MDSSNNACPITNSAQRKRFSAEHSPRMLKDFLVDDSNSCSSFGSKTFPRKPCNCSTGLLKAIDVNATQSLTRSRSKATSTTISAFQAMINTVKSFHFTVVKPPSILPRSLSRKLSKKSLRDRSENKENEIKITLTVKDIMRWRSFQDRVDEIAPPLDLTSSPQHCTTTTTTTTGSTATTPSSSKGSSWCDSDFTSEYLPCWSGNSEVNCENEDVEVGKKYLRCVGEASIEEMTEARTSYTAEGPKAEEGEKQQLSPVCVIDFEFEEDEESSLSFDHSLANVETAKQKLMQKIRRFENLAKLDPVNLDEWISMDENTSSGEDDVEGEETNIGYGEEEANYEIEERPWRLLNDVKAASSLGGWKNNEDQLLLDFFRDELKPRTCERRNLELDCELFNTAKAWLNGEHSPWIGWEVEHQRQAYVRETDKAGKWSKFEAEQEELAFETENGMLDLLVDELLLDLISF